jgi:hypothetical protein
MGYFIFIPFNLFFFLPALALATLNYLLHKAFLKFYPKFKKKFLKQKNKKSRR